MVIVIPSSSMASSLVEEALQMAKTSISPMKLDENSWISSEESVKLHVKYLHSVHMTYMHPTWLLITNYYQKLLTSNASTGGGIWVSGPCWWRVWEPVDFGAVRQVDHASNFLSKASISWVSKFPFWRSCSNLLKWSMSHYHIVSLILEPLYYRHPPGQQWSVWIKNV